MNPEEKQELQQLIDFLKENGVAEFELERPDQKVSIKFANAGGSIDLASLAPLLAQGRGAGPAPQAAAPPREAAEGGAATAAHQSSEACTELSRLSEGMQGRVARFRLPAKMPAAVEYAIPAETGVRGVAVPAMAH